MKENDERLSAENAKIIFRQIMELFESSKLTPTEVVSCLLGGLVSIIEEAPEVIQPVLREVARKWIEKGKE